MDAPEYTMISKELMFEIEIHKMQFPNLIFHKIKLQKIFITLLVNPLRTDLSQKKKTFFFLIS